MLLHRKQLYDSADNRKNSVGHHHFSHWRKKNSLIWLNHLRHGCLPITQITITNIPKAKTGQIQQKGESERTKHFFSNLEIFFYLVTNLDSYDLR